MKESIEAKILAYTIVTTIVLCVVWFFCNTRLDYRKTVKHELEWGRYVMAMNLLPYDEVTGRIAEVQKNIPIPIAGFKFDGLKPVKAYLVDGTTREIIWKN